MTGGIEAWMVKGFEIDDNSVELACPTLISPAKEI